MRAKYVLITRHPADCVELQAFLDPCGLTLRPYPVLRLEDVNDDAGWQELLGRRSDEPTPTWIVMASPRAPHRFARGCRDRGAENLLELPAAVVGTGTAEATEEAGLRVELVGPGDGQGLAQELVGLLDAPTTIVFACGRHRRPELPRILGEGGHSVLPVVVYRMDPTPPRELPPLGPSLDAVVLTSPRAATFYLEGVGGRPLPCPHWALGPTTRQAAAALGIDCRIPREPTMKSLAEELCRN
jgi:uroporphyrinogen-III synthase